MSVDSPGQLVGATTRSAVSAPVWLAARPGGFWRWTAWAALAVAAATRVVVATHDLAAVDLHVYRQAGFDLIGGHSPYAPTGGLPFTYPPVAALLSLPLAVGPEWLTNLIFLTANLAATATIVVVTGRQVGLSTQAMWWTLPAALVLSPTWRTLELGQVNLILAAIVVLDAFVIPARYRGWATGIAAGVKLVPAVFILYFVVTRQRAAAGRLIAGMAGTAAVGLAVMSSDSLRYWLVLLRDPDRIGDIAYIDNVSLRGVLSSTACITLLEAVLMLGVLAAVAVWCAARAAQRGDQLGALVAIALFGLVASPVSWTHHWVWCAALLIWVLAHAKASIGAALLSPAVVAVTVMTPLEWSDWLLDWLAPLRMAYLVLAVLAVAHISSPATRTRRAAASVLVANCHTGTGTLTRQESADVP